VIGEDDLSCTNGRHNNSSIGHQRRKGAERRRERKEYSERNVKKRPGRSRSRRAKGQLSKTVDQEDATRGGKVGGKVY